MGAAHVRGQDVAYGSGSQRSDGQWAADAGALHGSAGGRETGGPGPGPAAAAAAAASDSNDPGTSQQRPEEIEEEDQQDREWAWNDEDEDKDNEGGDQVPQYEGTAHTHRAMPPLSPVSMPSSPAIGGHGAPGLGLGAT